TVHDEPLGEQQDREFCDLLERTFPNYDIVIVADYGHGMLSPHAIQTICSNAQFLAVNTQSNAGNHGFNMISKYPRADYVCLAQREVALETRSQRLTADEMVRHVADRLGCPRVMMTQGSNGTLFYTAPSEYHRVPALATKVVDRVGAGDAVLCVTALAVAMNAPPEV